MLQPIDKNDVAPKLKVVEKKDVMPICKRAGMGMVDNCALCEVKLPDIYKSCSIKYFGVNI